MIQTGSSHCNCYRGGLDLHLLRCTRVETVGARAEHVGVECQAQGTWMRLAADGCPVVGVLIPSSAMIILLLLLVACLACLRATTLRLEGAVCRWRV
jgi:hypothetical protein